MHGLSNVDHTMEDPPHYKKFKIDVLMSDVASFAREKRQTQTTLKTHQFKPLTNLSQPPVNGVVMVNQNGST